MFLTGDNKTFISIGQCNKLIKVITPVLCASAGYMEAQFKVPR
jgi:hypothetical protein